MHSRYTKKILIHVSRIGKGIPLIPYNLKSRISYNSDEQGVIIPAQNIVHLILPENICTSVQNGEFSIYPIITTVEGMEILTGMIAGIRNRKGKSSTSHHTHLVENELRGITHLDKNHSS